MTRPTVACLYARVSCKSQDHLPQVALIREYALKRGFELTPEHEYIDHGYSGASSKRPALDALMVAAKARRVDAVIVWKFDRFARSTRHLVNALAEFKSLGIAFISLTEQIDTSSPMGAAMFAVISAMAQLERDLVSERVKASLEYARTVRGIRLGRPPIVCDVAAVVAAWERLKSVRQTASQFHLSRTYVHRLVQAHKSNNGGAV